MRHLGEKNAGINIYEKIIKEKEKHESQKTQEIMNLIIEIMKKKKEGSQIEKKISDNFEKINQNYFKYKRRISKINIEIDYTRDLYNKVKDTEYTEFEKVTKLNQLQKLKLQGENFEKKLNDTKKELYTFNNKLELTKKQLSDDLDICQNEIAYMKIVYLILVKAQRNYYFEILQNGYDTRATGLVWVVRRLLELQTKLEYFEFPKFLDNQQIDYLMEMANLSLEEMQLKIILKIVQQKRNNIENDVNKQIMNKMLEFTNNNYIKRKSITALSNEIKIMKKMQKMIMKFFHIKFFLCLKKYMINMKMLLNKII